MRGAKKKFGKYESLLQQDLLFFTDAKTDSGFSGGVILYAFIPEVIGVIKDCVGEVSFVTNFIPCAMIYPAINDFNRSATTIKIPNLDQYNWPNSY